MSRRPRRTRAEELDAHAKIGTAAAELCRALIVLEPQLGDLVFARKVILDGVAQLELEQQAAVAPAPAELKA